MDWHLLFKDLKRMSNLGGFINFVVPGPIPVFVKGVTLFKQILFDALLALGRLAPLLKSLRWTA